MIKLNWTLENELVKLKGLYTISNKRHNLIFLNVAKFSEINSGSLREPKLNDDSIKLLEAMVQKNEEKKIDTNLNENQEQL